MTLKAYLLKLKFLYTCSLYENYFKMVQQINNQNKRNSTENNLQNQDRSKKRAHRQIVAFQMVLFLYASLLLLGALWGEEGVPELVHLSLCNWFYFEGVPQVHLVWIFANVVLGMFMIKLFYFQNNGRTFAVLYGLVQQNSNDKEKGDRNDKMILSSSSSFFINANSRFCRQNIRLVEFINQWLMPLGNVSQIISNLGWNCFLIFTLISYYRKLKDRGLLYQWKVEEKSSYDQMIEKFSKKSPNNIPNQDLSLLLANFSFLAFGITIFTISRIYTEFVCTVGVLVAVTFISLKVRLEQTWEHLRTGKQSFFGELRLRLHLRYSVDSLAFLTDLNRIYGTTMWAFFLVQYPENAAMWMGVLLMGESTTHQSRSSLGLKAPVSAELRALVLVTAVLSDLFTVALHYKAIRLTQRLFDCAGYLTSVAVRSKSIGNLQWSSTTATGSQTPSALLVRLKLERYLELFHSTARPHTVTYGRQGPVTTASFGRSIFYYVKMLLFMKKLLN